MPRLMTFTTVLLLLAMGAKTSDARPSLGRARQVMQNQQKAQQKAYEAQQKYELELQKQEAEFEKQAAAKKLEKRNAAADAARKAKEHNREVAKARLANGNKPVVKSEKNAKPSKLIETKASAKSDAKADSSKTAKN